MNDLLNKNPWVTGYFSLLFRNTFYQKNFGHLLRYQFLNLKQQYFDNEIGLRLLFGYWHKKIGSATPITKFQGFNLYLLIFHKSFDNFQKNSGILLKVIIQKSHIVLSNTQKRMLNFLNLQKN